MRHSPVFCRKPLRGQLLRRIVFLLLPFLVLPFLSGSAPAESGEKVVRAGWYESSYSRKNLEGRRSGYAYEYQVKVAAYAGWRYEYVEGSWQELLQMLIRGDIDFMADVSWTEERSGKILYPVLPMGKEDYCLFISRDRQDISAADYSTLSGKRIGVNKSSIQEQFLRDWAVLHGVDCEIIELSTSEEDSLRMLSRGELDALVTVDTFVKEFPVETGQPVPVCKIGSSDFYFAVSGSRPDLLSDLNRAMNRIQEENRYFSQQLYEKYFADNGAGASLTPAEKAWLDHHGPVRIGYQDHYLSFCAADPDTGELTGALRDYLAEASGCFSNGEIVFEPVAFSTAADAYDALRKGEVDCVFPANLSPGDGEASGLYLTPPILRTDVLAVVRQADLQLFSGREHIIVAVNEGNPNYESCLRENFPAWHPVIYPTTSDCLKAVSDNVADCVLVSSYRYNHIARQCEREKLTAVDTGAALDFCFAVSAGRPHLYSVLARIPDLVPESTVNTALSRHMTEDAKSTLQDYLEDHPGGIIGVSAAVLLVILFFMLRSMKAQRKAARLISATETDALTGLYNRGYFLQYAAHMRLAHPDIPMDAVVVNIDRFHSVNALRGRDFGDRVLRSLGSEIRAAAAEAGGIAGRFEADRFHLYISPRPDYSALYNRFQSRMNALASPADIRLRMGVMPWKRELDVVQLFDKARTACSLAREIYGDQLILFDAKMQERENYEQRLLNDLRQALNSFEFEVHYQPQFDIQSDPPKLISAEALVRWNHPELGLIPPGDFIPLFERHGEISGVDRFVWSEAARQISRWRSLFGITLPVSVNLSRVDVFDPSLEQVLDRLLAENSLSRDTLRLEVTESAYTGNASQVIQVVENLRRKGYLVEMDDFGSGYSSLNMLSAMPVDVLKMDQAFIQKLGENEKGASLVALILGIAGSLKIPVVAEGVETAEQLRILKELGCPLVQGFWFSAPLPPEEFESTFLRKLRCPGAEGGDACIR